MPPKEKTESTELQVFNLEKFSIAQLPEFQAKKEEIGAVIALNPIVEIIDNSTYELAKKSRTTVKTLRTGLEKEQADVKRKIKTNILDVVDKEYDQLVLDVKKQESDRQAPITTYEAEVELKRQEKARLEQSRIDAIKKEIEDYTSQWKNCFSTMTFEAIEKVSADFLEAYTSFDTTILQEFEALFPSKVAEITRSLDDKIIALRNAENARLENIRLEQEAAELRAEKARLEALAKLAEEAELKAKAEREAFEKEKADFAEAMAIKKEEEKEAVYKIREKRLEELGMIYSDEHDTFWIKENADYILLASEVSDWGALEFEETFTEVKNIIQTAKDVVYDLPKTPPTEKVEIPEILVPELPTVNVCTSEETVKQIHEADCNKPEYCPKETTWDDIEKDFKSSGEKSYSKWLKSNYNVPTKL